MICSLADAAERVAVTGDSDFHDSRTLFGSPRLPLRIVTGSIGDTELLASVDQNLPVIVRGLEEHRCVDLSRTRSTWC